MRLACVSAALISPPGGGSKASAASMADRSRATSLMLMDFPRSSMTWTRCCSTARICCACSNKGSTLDKRLIPVELDFFDFFFTQGSFSALAMEDSSIFMSLDSFARWSSSRTFWRFTSSCSTALALSKASLGTPPRSARSKPAFISARSPASKAWRRSSSSSATRCSSASLARSRMEFLCGAGCPLEPIEALRAIAPLAPLEVDCRRTGEAPCGCRRCTLSVVAAA
mmetsp:Transcript_79446/g.229772  ORF Transcript_79446/g.229772 Transcript_79446/m.229772 type:complete len:227 (+) Transcript_79446:1425-2105(+)